MKRPIGFTISVIVFAWLATTGFMNGWTILSGSTESAPNSMGYIAMLYAIAAAVSAVGLWLMKPWAVIAIRCWMVACLLFLIIPEDMRNKMMQGGIAGMLGFFVFMIVVFWLFDRFVRSKFLNQN